MGGLDTKDGKTSLLQGVGLAVGNSGVYYSLIMLQTCSI